MLLGWQTPKNRANTGDFQGKDVNGKCCTLGSGRLGRYESPPAAPVPERWFEPTVILTCVRWYLRFSLSLRDVRELIGGTQAVRGPHLYLATGTQAYGPEVYRRQRWRAGGGSVVRQRISRFYVWIPGQFPSALGCCIRHGSSATDGRLHSREPCKHRGSVKEDTPWPCWPPKGMKMHASAGTMESMI
jgi:hypothetical protein